MSDQAKYIWFNGEIVPWENAKIHVMSHVLHYGSGVFEGIKCYKTDNGRSIFRLNEHIERLQQSGKLYGMNIPYSKEELSKACIDIIKLSEKSSLICIIKFSTFFISTTSSISRSVLTAIGPCEDDSTSEAIFSSQFKVAKELTSWISSF